MPPFSTVEYVDNFHPKLPPKHHPNHENGEGLMVENFPVNSTFFTLNATNEWKGGGVFRQTFTIMPP
jgi:hypothetical protein